MKGSLWDTVNELLLIVLAVLVILAVCGTFVLVGVGIYQYLTR